MNANEEQKILPVTEYLGKKSLLIILGITFSFCFAVVLLPYMFVGADIPIIQGGNVPVFGIVSFLFLLPCAYQVLKKTKNRVSKAYFFIPVVIVQTIAALFYTHLANLSQLS